MKNKLIPIVAVVIGIVAFILTYQFLLAKEKEVQRMKDDVSRSARPVMVLAAKSDMPSGTAIDKNDLVLISLPELMVPDQAITTPEETKLILGRKLLFPVQGGKPILWSSIEGGQPASQGLSASITHRMRAISLSIGGAAAVSGMVQPNDRVDVLGTFTLPSAKTPGEMETATLTVLQDVTVLAVGQTTAKNQTSARRQATTGYSTVTLLVTPREAELLVFAQQAKGSLTLALRNASDTYYETELPEIDFRKLKEELPQLNQYRQQKILNKAR